MSTELDLVRNFMNAPEVSPNLREARAALVDAIAHEESQGAEAPFVGTGNPSPTPKPSTSAVGIRHSRSRGGHRRCDLCGRAVVTGGERASGGC